MQLNHFREIYTVTECCKGRKKKEIQLQLIKNRPYFSFEPTQ